MLGAWQRHELPRPVFVPAWRASRSEPFDEAASATRATERARLTPSATAGSSDRNHRLRRCDHRPDSCNQRPRQLRPPSATVATTVCDVATTVRDCCDHRPRLLQPPSATVATTVCEVATTVCEVATTLQPVRKHPKGCSRPPHSPFVTDRTAQPNHLGGLDHRHTVPRGRGPGASPCARTAQGRDFRCGWACRPWRARPRPSTPRASGGRGSSARAPRRSPRARWRRRPRR